MGRRYRLAVVPQRQGRPHTLAVEAVATDQRFRELRAAGMDITEAETQMLGEHDWKRLNCRQAIRYRRNMGAAVKADFAFKEFCVSAFGPFGVFLRRPD